MHFLSKLARGSFSQSCLKCLRGNFRRPIHGTSSGQQSSVKMKIIKAPPITPKTYIGKNEELKRELSPHLTIYKPQLTSMLSITVRMTGFALGIMTWTVGLTSLFSDKKVEYFVNELKALDVNGMWWSAAKVVVVFPFSFHFVAGIRHILFDTAKLMEIKQFYGTGYAAIVLSCVLAVVLGLLEIKSPAVDTTDEET